MSDDVLVTDVHNATGRFRAMRDLLLERREDYEGALRDFAWPQLEHFNWALDWFDVIAQGNDRLALSHPLSWRAC